MTFIVIWRYRENKINKMNLSFKGGGGCRWEIMAGETHIYIYIYIYIIKKIIIIIACVFVEYHI